MEIIVAHVAHLATYYFTTVNHYKIKTKYEVTSMSNYISIDSAKKLRNKAENNLLNVLLIKG